jgi:predicted DsbA family dithiol-disulfide isomerase
MTAESSSAASSSEASSPDPKPMIIDVVSDMVCPWCFLGGEYLFAALAQIPEIPVEVRWRPYQLAPDIPPDGMPMEEYVSIRMGGDMSRFAGIQQQLMEKGAAVGLRFNFEASNKMPNTFNAHRLVAWAAQGGPGGQSRMVRALFSAHFEQGQDIGDVDMLIRIAVTLGMERDEVAAYLHSGAGAQNVNAEIEAAHRMGVQGVPFFLVDTQYAISGAQPPEALAQAFRQIAAGNVQTAH